MRQKSAHLRFVLCCIAIFAMMALFISRPTLATAAPAFNIPTDTPTPTSVPTETPTPTSVPTETPTPTPVTPTETPTPTDVPTDVPTETPTSTSAPVISPATATPVDTPVPGPTPVPTDTPTATPPPPVVLPETGGSTPSSQPWFWVALTLSVLAVAGFFFRRRHR